VHVGPTFTALTEREKEKKNALRQDPPAGECTHLAEVIVLATNKIKVYRSPSTEYLRLYRGVFPEPGGDSTEKLLLLGSELPGMPCRRVSSACGVQSRSAREGETGPELEDKKRIQNPLPESSMHGEPCRTRRPASCRADEPWRLVQASGRWSSDSAPPLVTFL